MLVPFVAFLAGLLVPLAAWNVGAAAFDKAGW